jgi:2,4-dienoyl-CoA reductase-like NADH-dependent reductase (Old Yellow Enzyme family)/NADH dehydrogenase FAD-containing subunit
MVMKSFEMLFTPIKIGRMEVKNRIVMPAMGTSLADREGTITDKLISYYRERAKGGAGYITVEHTCVHPSGKANDNMVCIYEDRFIDGFAKLAETIHHVGGKIVVQLNHAGRQTLSSITGQTIAAPSSIPCPIMKEKPRTLSAEEILRLVDDFSEAALRIKRAGCDGVEFHMAHGYLICQFLSPYSNHRNDEYGGNIHNRARFAREIIECTREKVGDDFPIICRISADEMVEGGLKLDQSRAIAQQLVKARADAIHVSACNYESYAFNMPCYYLEEGCFTHLAAGIKSGVDVPIIAVGRIRTPLMAEEVLQKDQADLVAMGRALIADPYLPEKAMRGRFEEIRPCLSCNKCVESISRDTLECTVNPDIGKEIKREGLKKGLPKKILVIGGGPGGMQAAKVARESDHHVTLYEAEAQLGGKLIGSSMAPEKGVYRELIQYFQNVLSAMGIELMLGTPCTPEIVKQECPDAVIVATGSKCCAKHDGNTYGHVMDYEEALADPQKVGKMVMVIGGGPKGAEIADYFNSMGRDVTLVEMKRKIGFGLPTALRFHLEKKLEDSPVKILNRTKLLHVTENGVKVHAKGAEQDLSGYDSVILAMGDSPNDALAKDLKELEIPLLLIGDAKKPRGIKEAIAEATWAATALDR